jgi:hypothetical protein
MDWREANRVDSVLGLAGNGVLHSHVRTLADDLCVRRAPRNPDPETPSQATDTTPRQPGATHPRVRSPDRAATALLAPRPVTRSG